MHVQQNNQLTYVDHKMNQYVDFNLNHSYGEYYGEYMTL